MRDGVDGVTIDSGHGLRSDERVDDRLFGGLHGGREQRIHLVIRDHLERGDARGPGGPGDSPSRRR